MKRPEIAEYVYPFSSLHEFAALREKIQSQLTGLAPQAARLFFMSINEAVNNSLFHGNQEDTSKKVTLTLMTLAEEIRVVICDEGSGFAYSEISCSDPLCEEGGRGLAFIKYGVDSYQYNAKGNEITLIKSLACK